MKNVSAIEAAVTPLLRRKTYSARALAIATGFSPEAVGRRLAAMLRAGRVTLGKARREGLRGPESSTFTARGCQR